MTPEVLLAAGYAGLLAVGAFVLEWLSSHSHKRSLRYRTAGFEYDSNHDHWICPEGQHLWPHEFDADRRLVRYRAKAHICNGCPRKAACTDSNEGREVVRPIDPWPHSEAGRFHRAIALLMLALAAMLVVVVLVREHQPAETALLAAVLVLDAFAARWLVRDFLTHPVNPPEPSVAHGLQMVTAEAGGQIAGSRWASQNRIEGRK